MIAANIKSRVSGRYPLVITSGWSSTTVDAYQVWPARSQELDYRRTTSWPGTSSWSLLHEGSSLAAERLSVLLRRWVCDRNTWIPHRFRPSQAGALVEVEYHTGYHEQVFIEELGEWFSRPPSWAPDPALVARMDDYVR